MTLCHVYSIVWLKLILTFMESDESRIVGRGYFEVREKLYVPEYFARPEKLSPEFRKFMVEARREGMSFLGLFANRLDLRDANYEDSISDAFDLMCERGLDNKAESICTQCFKKVISTYGVGYPLFDTCTGTCKFCGASQENVKKLEGNFERAALNLDDVVNEVLATMLQGHEEHCLLLGDMKEEVCMRNLLNWIPEIIRVCGSLGLKTLVLNIQTLSTSSYLRLARLVESYNRKLGTNVTLNIRTFMETYDHASYADAIPMPNGTKDQISNMSRKWNQRRRYETQENAAKAGLPVGMGLLLGISPRPLKDLMYLVAHQQRLLTKGVDVHRVAILSAHNVPGLGTDVRFDLGYGSPYEKLMIICYVLFRIFGDPSVSLVASERDSMALLKKLFRYANHSTTGVRPFTGGTMESMLTEQYEQIGVEVLKIQMKQAKSKHARKIIRKLMDQRTNKVLPIITQANVYSNYPEDFITMMKMMGYTVALNRDSQRLKKIQDCLSGRIGLPITVNNFGGTHASQSARLDAD